MAANPFHEWLTEVATDAVVVRPDDIGAECMGNLWRFSLSPEQAAAVTPADVANFASAVADGREAWLSARGAGPMVLYWWHDEQAGLLRFSLVSAVHGTLPFACEVIQASSLEEIAADWLGSQTLHGIPWNALHVVPWNSLRDPTPDEELPPRVLPVWSVVLGQTPKPPMQPTGSAGG